MSKGLRFLGILLLFIGGVWLFQGIGVLQGSVMTGSSFWGWAGTGTAVVGVVLLVVSIRSR